MTLSNSIANFKSDLIRWLWSRSVRSLDDWDRKSANSSSEKRTHSPVIGNTISDAVAGMHWLTLGCFIEGISPQSIVFPPDLLERIENELDELASFDSLESYAAALEGLSQRARLG